MVLIDGIFRGLLTLQAVLSLQQGAAAGGSEIPAVRRIAATTSLAAQEYGLGVRDGQVIAAAEVDEAQLFLEEARRTAGLLPPEVSRTTGATLDSLMLLIKSRAAPDSVLARVNRLNQSLSQRLGVPLEELPAVVPTLSRGASVFQADCAGCHGALGHGDGPQAASLNPAPPNLSDASALADRTPLDFYRRITLGVAGTAMPSFETALSPDDRWAAAVYATLLRLPPPSGDVPPALRAFATTARMSDRDIASALGGDSLSLPLLQQVAAVRTYQVGDSPGQESAQVFGVVRAQLDTSFDLARAGKGTEASTVAFDAYMSFERVEPQVRAQNSGLANDLEGLFATFRTRAAGGATIAELSTLRSRLWTGLEEAERTIADRMSPVNLFIQSFFILLREGLEAILIIGALVAMVVKMGVPQRRRDVHVGVVAAIGASLVTAVLLETVLTISPSHREALEGITMAVAAVMLFYVSYWLLSKMEVAKWNRFVKGKVTDALSSGSALALASVAFLAVYREGFETVLFYKALFLAGGAGSPVMPVLAGILAGSVILVIVYIAINRFGVRLPLRPFFAVTSAFLYYMAFVFSGKGIAELQEGGLVSSTYVSWAPRIPSLGIYPTAESLSAQGLLLALLLLALVWTFVVEPRRLRVTSQLVPEPRPPAGGPAQAGEDRELLRSLERMDADLAELRAEIERLRSRLGSGKR